MLPLPRSRFLDDHMMEIEYHYRMLFEDELLYTRSLSLSVFELFLNQRETKDKTALSTQCSERS